MLFVSELGDLVESQVWPNLQFEANEIREKLKMFLEWDLRVVPVGSLRCVYFIAQSVTTLSFTQSYAAAGHPKWLDSLFVNEREASVV